MNPRCLPFRTDKRTNNNHSYNKIYFVLLSIQTAGAAVEKYVSMAVTYYTKNVIKGSSITFKLTVT